MSGLTVSPLAVVNQIKSNLQDRYESGYPILKELLQNADDARARRFRLDALPGWPDACNPLLRGPGLLVVNDGRFCRADRRGILAFGESVKAADRAAIGKFGLGQKAVFHLCDAFVVHAVGFGEPFTRVVNPFLKVEVDGNVTDRWDCVNDEDTARLSLAAQDFGERALVLWLPLRRDDLIPAPDAGFSTLRPEPGTIITELARTDDLRVLLTALRHLKSIEVQRQGEMLCSVRVDDTQGRLRGPDDQPPSRRSFRGTIDTGQDDSARFIGREATIRDQDLERLRCSDHWPKTISALSSKPGREKGEQHGAATLLRTGSSTTRRSDLKISWAVFLPVSETESTVLGIEIGDLGRIYLLLHGYFFLDSGRRHIEGLGEPASNDEPADVASLRRAWNTRLRDTAVLPLVPAILRDAFDHGIMTAKELAYLTSAVANSSWFKTNRTAFCRETALVRVLAGPEVRPAGRVAWELAPAGAELRSLPATLADSPELADRLFGHLHGWAQARNVKLCIDQSASLIAEPMRWPPAELDSLLQSLSAQAFLSPPLAALLASWLSEAVLSEDARAVVAPHVVRALRQAMLGTMRLAPSNHISDILQHVPRDRLFALRSAMPRAVLSALSNSGATILPVRSEWLQPADHQPRPSETDLSAFLRALAPLVEGADGTLAVRAAADALALVDGFQISDLATQQEFMDIRVLRTREPMHGSIVRLTFAEFYARSRRLLMFRSAPNVESRLRTVVGALRDLQPLVVDAPTDHGIHDLTVTVNKEILSALIKTTSQFGRPADRARLITLLSSLEGSDDPEALRRLCAGDRNAGAPDAKLWNGDGLPAELECIIASMLDRRRSAFLVPSAIMTELTGAKRRELAIRDLDTPALERLIEDGIDTLRQLNLSESERKALLTTGLRDALLRRLPIHDLSDDTVGSAEGLCREGDRWSIPVRFRGWVVTVRLFDDPNLRSKQEILIPVWSPRAQISAALSQTAPYLYPEEILDAIADAHFNDARPGTDLIDRLRTIQWLTADDSAVSPKELLTLPPEVDEAAGRNLARPSRYTSTSRLPERIRTHPGFRYVRETLMPDKRSSVRTLAQMIVVVGLQGRLGTMDDLPIVQFTELARIRADLKLPGWSLLAAVLSSFDDDPDGVRKVAGSFREVSNTEPKMAAQFLDALATLADVDPAHRRAAERVYRYGFEAVAKWNVNAQQCVFRHTRVPTKSAGWRTGKEVVVEDGGVVSDHVLAREYAALFSPVGDAFDGHMIDSSNESDQDQFDICEIRERSVAQHSEFLEAWRGRIPDGLVAVYLDVVQRHNPLLQDYRASWAGDPMVDRDLDRLSLQMPVLFLVEKIQGGSVEAISLSGDLFDAPLDNHTSLAIHARTKYKFWRGEERRTKIVTVHVRTTDYGKLSIDDRVQVFRNFIETAVAQSVSAEDMRALRRILDRVAHMDQTTLEDTQRLLHDRLPTLLAALKLPAQSNGLRALRQYETEEVRASDDYRVNLKETLWQSIREPAAAGEILAAVRDRIMDQGYGLHRVLFELFQNADDAYVQRESETPDACLRVDFGSTDDRRLQIVHWGRPINDPGSDVEIGRSRGYDRDLLNMLVMNFSEKRPEENVTGKFGLGFKCVHLLSDSVGVASGFVALRTVGGILPEQWSDGLRLVDELSRVAGRRATVIDVPYTTDEMAKGGELTEQAFREAMPWLPAFAHRIRRIEVLGGAPATISCMVSKLPGDCGLSVVSIQDARTHSALRFDLGDGYTLLLKVGAEGPECFEPAVSRVWNLAPLEENLPSGWLLNGPFPVDPGRGRLAGSIKDRQALFVNLGKALGERLLSLHDLVEKDWEELAGTLGLNVADNDARLRFWSRLFDVMSRDLDDDLARRLHAVDRGYGLLIAERPVVPTRLPVPFDALVCASSIERVTGGALAATSVLQATRQWESSGQLVGRVVGPEVATRMRRLGFDQIQAITLSELLRMEMGEDKRVDVNLGTRLGQVITPHDVENEPLLQERQRILDIAKQANFVAQDGAWRPVRALSSRCRNDEEETLLCGFAPDSALLREDYKAESLRFFEVARRQSGYGPMPALLREWMDAAHSEDRQRAALRYLVHGRQGRALAKLVQDRPPTWIVTAQLLTHPLLECWTDEERKQLVLEIDPGQIKVDPPPKPPPPPHEVSSILTKVHRWWMDQRQHELPLYVQGVYPEEFCSAGLADVDGGIDSAAWFTMFALACFRSFGRPQDETHRNFIHLGWQAGWWTELAHAEPPASDQPWLARLERWSAPDRLDERYHQWQRTLVDLYTIARGMTVYVELIRKFPRFVKKHGLASLDVILRPGESKLAQELGLDAAPIRRALGIGANWLIRELARKGVYNLDEARLVGPCCWAPTKRVRELLTALDPDLHLTAHYDVSPRIHKFVTCHVGADLASFGGDFDLPLQIVTRTQHRALLNQWFNEAGRDAPEFGDDAEDGEDYA